MTARACGACGAPARDGLEERRVYACDDCIAAGTNEDRAEMGVTAEEWSAVRARLESGPGRCDTCGTQCVADGSLAVLCPQCDADPDAHAAAQERSEIDRLSAEEDEAALRELERDGTPAGKEVA